MFMSSLVTTSAVNMETMIPIAKVLANPLIVPLPRQKRTAAAISVVTLPSMIAERALLYPLLMAVLTFLPAVISSRIRAKIITFASTAIPMESRIPAMPGSVSVTSKPLRTISTIKI